MFYFIALLYSFLHLKTQIYLISKKITLKEYVVIKDKKLIKSYKFSESLKNVLDFLLKSIEKSDI